MPTNKNKMQYLLDDIYYKKFNTLCKELKRKSASDMTKYIVEKFIDEYEAIHGEMRIEEDAAEESTGGKTVNIGRDNKGTINM